MEVSSLPKREPDPNREKDMYSLYRERHKDLTKLGDNVFAVDTETTLFDEHLFGASRKTRISPHTTGMRLILGSIAGEGTANIYYKDDLCAAVRKILMDGGTIIFHNAAFDVHVLIEWDPSLKPLLVEAIQEYRVRDTRVLELLLRIAKGRRQDQLVGSSSLKDLAKKYAGMNLDKGAARTSFSQFENTCPDPVADKGHLQYALDDAIATYRVYAAQYPQADLIARTYDGSYPELPYARERFGVLAERNHVAGDIALFWLQRHPVRVDLDLVSKGREILLREQDRLAKAMAGWTTTIKVKRKRKAGDVFVDKDMPWAKEKKDGTVSLSLKAIGKELEAFAEEGSITPDRTPRGDITLKRDFWSEHIPAATGEQLEAPERVVDRTGRLSVWMAYSRLRIMDTRYLYPLAASERHYPSYYSIGARTTRTSANKFPIQQTPKRRDSIRGLFIPEDGAVFIEADYKAAELTALAQVYHLMFGGSRLGAAINDGQDAHLEKARSIWEDFDELDEERQGELRQACKAVNFGLPGGMGAAKFALFARGYGLYLSDEEARLLRNKALGADVELRNYLADSRSLEGRVKGAARNLGIPWTTLVTNLRAWRDEEEGTVHWYAAYKRLRCWSNNPAEYAHYDIPVRPGFRPRYDLWKASSRSPSGSIRGRASYTEAHNFPFQACVADVGKLALFNLFARWSEECQWRPVNFVHDSITLQTKGDEDEQRWTRELLELCMKKALDELCPDINGGVDAEPPKARWGKLSGLFAELAHESA